MTNYKRPKFDDAKYSMITEDYDATRPIFFAHSFDVNHRVSVKYYGKDVDMIITKKFSETEYIGKIYGFETMTTEFEGLILNEEVIFNKRHVWGITK